VVRGRGESTIVHHWRGNLGRYDSTTPPPAEHISYAPDREGLQYGWVKIINPEVRYTRKGWHTRFDHCCRPHPVHSVSIIGVCQPFQRALGSLERLPVMQQSAHTTEVSGSDSHSSQTTMRQPTRPELVSVRGSGDHLRLSVSRTVRSS